MSDTFVPLTAATETAAGGTLQMKVLSQAETKPAFTPLIATGIGTSSSPACGPPVLTLQRQGDLVSGIRVECGCGQVIELKCVY